MIPLFKVAMSGDLSPVLETLQSGMITQSSKVELFEDKLKSFFNFPHILTLNSATSGLTLALRLLNLSENDEVLCTPLTCFATTASVLANKLKIKWVDTDPNTANMDLDDLQKKISPTTKAILFVHWGGYPIDLDRLKAIAGNIPIIEDCAHSFGATYKDKFVGTTGNIAVFSLQAIKHLTTGDGGLIFLPNEDLYKRAKLLRWFGIDREAKQESKNGKQTDSRMENNITEWGYKFHMNDISATIGLCNFPVAERNLVLVRKNSNYYDRYLQNLKNVSLLSRVPDSNPACWLYSLKVKHKQDFIKFMTRAKIAVSQVHKRNDINDCVVQYKTKLPNLDKLEKELVCIPCGWWVSEPELYTIVECIKLWDTLDHIKVRPLHNFDRDVYLELLGQLNGYKYEKERFDVVFRLLSNSSIYVLEVYGKVVSTIRLNTEIKFSNNVLHIEDFVTDKEYRNMGYGKMLLKAVLENVNKREYYKIVLGCNDGNVGLYENLGFFRSGNEMRIVL